MYQLLIVNEVAASFPPIKKTLSPFVEVVELNVNVTSIPISNFADKSSTAVSLEIPAKDAFPVFVLKSTIPEEIVFSKVGSLSSF